MESNLDRRSPIVDAHSSSALEDDLPVLTTRWPDAPVAEAFADCGGELGLYPVMPSADWIERLLPLGIGTIQLRVKDRSPAETEAEIARAVALSRQHGARLFINDYWQLAIKHGAYGVHLGQEDLDTADLAAIRAAGLRLGVSNHSYYELARAHGGDAIAENVAPRGARISVLLPRAAGPFVGRQPQAETAG